MRKGLFKFKLIILMTIIAIFLPLGVLVADNLVADGDGVAPIVDNPLNIGTISAGTTATGNVQLGIRRLGTAGATNTFGNSQLLTVSLVSSDDSRVTANMIDSAIKTSSFWTSVGTNVMAMDTATSSVTVTVPSGATPGTYTANLNYQVTGLNSSGSTISRPVTLVVNYTIEASANVAPVVTETGNQITDEGLATAIALGSFTDNDSTGPWTVDVNWGDGSAVETLSVAAAGNLGSRSHTYADNGSYTVIVDVSDEEAAKGSTTFSVAVSNVAPVLGTISGPVDPVLIGTAVNLSASFTDQGILDTQTAVWNWGDGQTSAGLVDETNGSGSVTGSNSYTVPGVYEVSLTLTDKDGGSDTEWFRYIVVYDPNGGFVTGGGWIDSPVGAYMADPTLTGKASFGFVSKYLKGATIPTGNTEFQFKAGSLNFQSSNYDWLVVAGSKAMYKGTGTINGTGNYGFILSAVDSRLGDQFRIRIWDKDTGATVYDNKSELSAYDSASELTTISGGSIVVHSKK